MATSGGELFGIRRETWYTLGRSLLLLGDNQGLHTWAGGTRQEEMSMVGLGVARDISLMWLIFLTLIAILPIGVIFFFCIKGMIRLRALAILYLPLVQEKTRFVADKTEEISGKVVEPIINAKARTAQASGIRSAIFTRRQNP
jgi:hypothetical protein